MWYYYTWLSAIFPYMETQPPICSLQILEKPNKTHYQCDVLKYNWIIDETVDLKKRCWAVSSCTY